MYPLKFRQQQEQSNGATNQQQDSNQGAQMHEVFSQPLPALPDWWKAIVNALEAASPWLDFEHGRIHSDMPTDLACTLAHAYLTAPTSFWHEWEQLAPSRARAVLTWAGQQRHHP